MVVVKFLVFVSEVVSIFLKILTWIIGGAKGYLCPTNSIIGGTCPGCPPKSTPMMLTIVYNVVFRQVLRHITLNNSLHYFAHYACQTNRFANFVFLFQLTVFSPSSLLRPPFFCTFRVTHGLFFTTPTALGIVSSITSFRLFFNKFQLSFTLASLGPSIKYVTLEGRRGSKKV